MKKKETKKRKVEGERERQTENHGKSMTSHLESPK